MRVQQKCSTKKWEEGGEEKMAKSSSAVADLGDVCFRGGL